MMSLAFAEEPKAGAPLTSHSRSVTLTSNRINLLSRSGLTAVALHTRFDSGPRAHLLNQRNDDCATIRRA